ncbi:hypothetical protein BB561_002026 [Smittium simulii]|uniref:Nucleolus and neural progenitor protein-like N-terminal domain-containing protein n=1 Tax=Smittium simulii TaxID=133385 RepID=A0A2T9YS21_9FUNG|nr:hypothetical protein BB561_002026 [Smittium simulii]
MDTIDQVNFNAPKTQIFKRAFLDKHFNTQDIHSNDTKCLIDPNNVSTFNHSSNLNRLEYYFRHASLIEMVDECTLLNKIIIMYHNQQRRSSNFKKLQALNVCFKKLLKANPKQFIQNILKSFYSGQQHKKKQNEYDQVPSKMFMKTCALRALELIKLAIKILDLSKQVYTMYLDQVQQTFFMNLSLVICGLVSRLSVLTVVFKNEFISLYGLLLNWIPNLPADKNIQSNIKFDICNDLLSESSKLEESLTHELSENHNLQFFQDSHKYKKAEDVPDKILLELKAILNTRSNNQTHINSKKNQSEVLGIPADLSTGSKSLTVQTDLYNWNDADEDLGDPM